MLCQCTLQEILYALHAPYLECLELEMVKGRHIYRCDSFAETLPNLRGLHLSISDDSAMWEEDFGRNAFPPASVIV
jgi:hypothetical protein